MKFKAGDKVECVHGASDGNITYFTKGNIYTVTSSEILSISGNEWLTLNNDLGNEDGYSAKFFKLAINQSDSKTGHKDDSQKPDLSLIPTDALLAIGKALTYGTKRYERHNFRNGLAYSRLVAAAMRHLTAWNEGEIIDKESGNNHLDHCLASLSMLKYMEVNKPEFDDRFKKETPLVRAQESFNNEVLDEAIKKGR